MLFVDSQYVYFKGLWICPTYQDPNIHIYEMTYKFHFMFFELSQSPEALGVSKT